MPATIATAEDLARIEAKLDKLLATLAQPAPATQRQEWSLPEWAREVVGISPKEARKLARRALAASKGETGVIARPDGRRYTVWREGGRNFRIGITN